ncbi:MAG: hypothetical protein WD510_02455, partial [Balneolaceae bacterium]
MNTLISIKNQFSKFFAILMLAGFVASCAAVTDANLESDDTLEIQPVEQATSTDQSSDNIWLNGNGDDMDPIRDAPP